MRAVRCCGSGTLCHEWQGMRCARVRCAGAASMPGRSVMALCSKRIRLLPVWVLMMSGLKSMRTQKTVGLGILFMNVGLLAFGLLVSGCSSEIGRVPLIDSDVSCLRKQMKGPMFLSFPLAANTCQRMSNHNFVLNEKNAHPLPLELKDAPDLQKQADEYGYSYTK